MHGSSVWPRYKEVMSKDGIQAVNAGLTEWKAESSICTDDRRPTSCRRLGTFAWGAAVCALGLSFTSLSQEPLQVRPAWDPECRLPVLTLPAAPSQDERWVLRGGEDVSDPAGWPVVLEMRPDGHSHHWHDPAARAERRRFFRMERQPATVRDSLPNFRLTDHRGRSHELFREGDAKAVVLAFTDAAGLSDLWEHLGPVVTEFQSQGVIFWLVNPIDDRNALKEAADALELPVPVLHDAAQIVSRRFAARQVGDVLVLENQFLRPVYRGPISGAFEGVDLHGEGTPPESYLSSALTRLLAGEEPFWERVSGSGRALPLADIEVPNYREHIGPLLRERCASCHKPGGIGSWAMTGHATVAEKASDVRIQLLEGLMPPWHADPTHLAFENDFSLTTEEQAKLVAWIDAGAPRGDGPDPLAEVQPPDEAWPMGTPDQILSIPVQSIPATGEVDYQYLIVNNPYPEDVWLKAAAIQPGNTAVVHHCLVFYGQDLMDILQVQGGLGGFYAGYVPGMVQVEFPEGTAKRLQGGGFFVFQMHYTPNGMATTDQTRMGLYLADAPPTAELHTTAAHTTDIRIPANSRTYSREAERVFDKDVTLYEMSPHMHYRGDWMRFDAIYPDGTKETLLNVPKYDFAWQAMYRLKDPKQLPAGTKVRVTGGFDNSVWNAFNPNPGAVVRFGEQTNDEMFIGYMNYAETP